MGKKDGAKSRSERFEAEQTMTPAGVAEYLEGIARGLRDGTLALGPDGDGLRIPVASSAELEVEARRGKRKSRLALKIAFRAEDSIGDGGGSPAATRSTASATGNPAIIPDEMSF
jgi:amphi-Trp domain-containing protein